MKFSIILPCFNSKTTIKKAIFSVINQTFKDWELIIVDDGSTDGTFEDIAPIIGNYKSISYFKQNNSGPGIARNNGMKIAKGKYICFLDSDDYWDLRFLDKINDALAETDSDLIFYDIVRENENRKVIGYSKPSKFLKCRKDKLLYFQISGILEWGMNKVVKKALIKQHDLKFSEDDVGEEALFSVSLISNAKSYVFVKDAIYHYVNMKESQHKKGDLDPWFIIFQNMLAHLSKINLTTRIKEDAVNNLSMKSLAISVKRICHELKYRDAKMMYLQQKLSYEKFSKPLKSLTKDLELKVKIVKILLKIHCFWLVYLLA